MRLDDPYSEYNEDRPEIDWKEGYETCAYCGCEVCERDTVPEVGDDDAWAELAEEHAADCRWILTRAQRLQE